MTYIKRRKEEGRDKGKVGRRYSWEGYEWTVSKGEDGKIYIDGEPGHLEFPAYTPIEKCWKSVTWAKNKYIKTGEKDNRIVHRKTLKFSPCQYPEEAQF